MRSLFLLLLLVVQSAATDTIPRVFEENRGQADPAVRFISRGSGFRVSLTSNGAILQLQRGARDTDAGFRLEPCGTTRGLECSFPPRSVTSVAGTPVGG